MARRTRIVACTAGLALLASCQWSCDGAPVPQVAAPPAPPVAALPRVVGDVAIPLPGRPDGSPAALEVRFLREDAVRSFLAARLEEGRREIEKTRHERERLREEVRRLGVEKDRAEAAWRYKIEEDLRRRMALQVRPPARVEDYYAAQKAFREDKRAAYDRAVAAVDRAEEREQHYEEQVRRASWYRSAEFLTEGLPEPVLSVRTDGNGRFEAELPGGRYAVVAAGTVPGEPPATYAWLLWLEVAPEGETVLRLRTDNLHGTSCAPCIVPAGDLSH